jgi:hypothetical protein
MFHFEVYIMADSSSESNSVMEVEDAWKITVFSDIGPDNNCIDGKLTRQLQEHYALKQEINIFPRPHHPSYNTLTTRTRSYENADWPETYPLHISMAEA